MEKPKRRSISKKVRFDVFKRDSFICQYCGQTPPKVVLEIDHINPVANGGSNDVDNLITSCFDCNRGKGAEELTTAPKTIDEKAKILAEKESQLNEYNKVIKKKRKRQDKDIDKIESIFMDYTGCGFASKFRESIRINFLEYLTVDTLEDAINSSCMKIDEPEQAISYFCGICWKIRKQGGA